jgi:hypothetical protein
MLPPLLLAVKLSTWVVPVVVSVTIAVLGSVGLVVDTGRPDKVNDVVVVSTLAGMTNPRV